jgi:hypothetical protein
MNLEALNPSREVDTGIRLIRTGGKGERYVIGLYIIKEVAALRACAIKKLP